MSELSISAIVLTLNEEIHIRRCLENAFRVAKEVFVIDSFFTDQTVASLKRGTVLYFSASIHV